MRFTITALLGLALLNTVSAAKNFDIRCETIRMAGTRTKTRYLPTHTAYKTVIKRPLSTVISTFTPQARTRTKVVITVATEVLRAGPVTGTVTTTSTDFQVFVPSTTITEAAYTPTITEYALLPPTTTFKTTVTSYTAQAPAPTLAGSKSKRSSKSYDDDDEDDDDAEEDYDDDGDEYDTQSQSLNDGTPITITSFESSASEAAEPDNGIRPMAANYKNLAATTSTQLMMNFDGYPGKNPGAQTDQGNGGLSSRKAHRGKQVICTPKVRVTSTVTKKPKVTVTETRRARRPTKLVVSTTTATMRSINYPASVTSIVRKTATVTVTTKPVTFTTKPTAPAVTVTKTLADHADPPRQTTILDL